MEAVVPGDTGLAILVEDTEGESGFFVEDDLDTLRLLDEDWEGEGAV